MQQRQRNRDGGAQRGGGASARVPRHPVHRLQGRIGNAATGRVLSKVAVNPATRRTLQRFDEAEHRALGDLALDARFRLPAATMYPELQLTFGDSVALGDYFEDVAEIKQLLRPSPGRDTAGQVYYAVLVKIRPTNAAERNRVLEAYKSAELWTQADIDAVEQRFLRLATRNIKHFPNPLVGDTTLPTADKLGRMRDDKPLGGVARYHHDHLDAVSLAISAGELREERYLGEAYAIDGFACHFLTDAFSGSHVRTPLGEHQGLVGREGAALRQPAAGVDDRRGRLGRRDRARNGDRVGRVCDRPARPDAPPCTDPRRGAEEDRAEDYRR